MREFRTVVCFLCGDLENDPVAPRVLDVLLAHHRAEPTGIAVDGADVLVARPRTGIELLIVRTSDVLSHDYPHYLPIMNDLFAHAEAAVVVNWHAGANAPDRILTAHSNGDVESGAWAPSDPRHLRNLLVSLDDHRRREGLDDFDVVVEATHWSGVQHGCDPGRVAEYDVPLYDLEIGSSPQSWSSPAAARVLADALEHVLDEDAAGPPVSMLCGGGVHCEHGFSGPIITARDDRPLGLSHILPNHWLVSGDYDDDAAAARRLDACVASIAGGVDLVVVHEKLKASYKAAFRALAERLGVPIVNHKALKRPLELG